MRRVLVTGFVFSVVAALAACGYTAGGHVGIDANISPDNGSINQPLDVPVTVDFNAEIGEPSDWLASFSLRTAEGEPTLCTEVVYDSEGLMATCVHGDLAPQTKYHVYLTGITAVNGQTIDFTTAIQ